MRKYIGLSAILAIAVAGSVVATAHIPEDVRTFPVTPEAENYWSRWRGPSGQGLVKGTNYVELSWHSDADLLGLERASNLGTAATWNGVNNALTREGSRRKLRLPLDTSATFYRLRSQ